MVTAEQLENLLGRPAVDTEGALVGMVGQVYVSDVTGQPDWVTLRTGPTGGGQIFAPLHQSRIQDGQLVLAVPGQLVRDSPRPELRSAGRLEEDQARAIHDHYASHFALSAGSRHGSGGQDTPESGTDAGPNEQDQYLLGNGSRAGGDVPRAGGDAATTVSEERLRVGTERVPVRRARLVKYMVTEQVTLTVTVSREEVRIEETDIISADHELPAATGTRGPDQPGWMILHAQQPAIQMQTVPVERVRLRTQTITGQQDISTQIRKEQIGVPEVDNTPDAGTAPVG